MRESSTADAQTGWPIPRQRYTIGVTVSECPQAAQRRAHESFTPAGTADRNALTFERDDPLDDVSALLLQLTADGRG